MQTHPTDCSFCLQVLKQQEERLSDARPPVVLVLLGAGQQGAGAQQGVIAGKGRDPPSSRT